MAEIITDEIVHEDDATYRVTTYDSGTIVKQQVQENGEPFSIPEILPEIPETEAAILETATNTEYLVALSELSM